MLENLSQAISNLERVEEHHTFSAQACAAVRLIVNGVQSQVSILEVVEGYRAVADILYLMDQISSGSQEKFVLTDVHRKYASGDFAKIFADAACAETPTAMVSMFRSILESCLRGWIEFMETRREEVNQLAMLSTLYNRASAWVHRGMSSWYATSEVEPYLHICASSGVIPCAPKSEKNSDTAAGAGAS